MRQQLTLKSATKNCITANCITANCKTAYARFARSHSTLCRPPTMRKKPRYTA